MGKTKDTGHLAHIVQYDASNNITIPAGLKVNGTDNVMTAAAMTAALGGYVPASRIITINGTALDLSADRSWTIAGGLTSFNTRTGAITLSSGDVTTALGYTPVSSAGGTIQSTPSTSTGNVLIIKNGNTTDNGNASATIALDTSAAGTMADIRLASTTPVGIRIYASNSTLTASPSGAGFQMFSNAASLFSGQMYFDSGANNSAALIFRTATTGGNVTTRFRIEANGTIKLSALTANGFVRTNNSDGTLSIDTNTYLTGITSSQVTTALGYTPSANTHTHAFADLTAKPTTLAGYGITDAASSTHNHDATYVPLGRTITINSTTFDLSANRSWTITATETDTLATVTARGASTSTPVVFSGNMAAWNATTPGLGLGTIQIGAANGNANYGGAITFAARDGGSGLNAQAGIYVVSDGAYGTRMYFATTDAYVTGSKTAISINEGGTVNFVRAVPTYGGTSLVYNSGTWGISVTGTAGGVAWSNVSGRPTAVSSFTNDSGYITSGYVSWGNISSKPGWMQSASLVESHSNANDWRNSGFYENGGGGSNWPSQTWYNSVNVRHSNQGNYHGFQIAMSYYDNNLWFRSYQGSGTFQSWIYAISSANIGSQTVSTANNLSGFDKTNPSFAAVYANNWFRVYGDCGLYTQDYGSHFRRNASSSHGAWEIFGYNKGGYTGLNVQDASGYNNNLMYEGGNGGMYTQNGNGWQWYYNLGSNCIGLGGSTTYNWVRAVVNGKLKIESDSIHTGWAYFDSNTQLAGGGNTLYNEYNYWYVWRNWGGWGGEWINRNGGDMIMNLYAMYSVTGSISDIRYKKDVEALPYGLNEIMQLNPIKYHYNLPKESMLANDPDYFLGFSAQEVQSIIPEAVHEKMDSNNTDGMLAITYDELVPVTVQAIKEQQVMIHNQNIRIQKLEALVSQLQNN